MAIGGSSPAVVLGLLIAVASLGSGGSRARPSEVEATGLVAPRHVGSSESRDQTHVPLICKQTLNH